jgi:antitoxin (DNA-binding transcriptional repressor) of toxin-antitoxin stability system
MLEVFRELEATGGELIVTERGRPVLKIVPIRPKLSVQEIFGDVQGQVVYFEDINTPTIDEWSEV